MTPRALMIGGIFLLARDPRALAAWYERHLGWHLLDLDEDGTSYIELYFREDDEPARRQHLVYAIMPGDPGIPNSGHIVNYRVDDIEAVVASLRRDGVETSPVKTGEDAEGLGKFARLTDPEGHRIELWQHLDET
jgi:catechol 2,3-dioxygenase-like lactoylglutathione lyase family enzyme